MHWGGYILISKLWHDVVPKREKEVGQSLSNHSLPGKGGGDQSEKKEGKRKIFHAYLKKERGGEVPIDAGGTLFSTNLDTGGGERRRSNLISTSLRIYLWGRGRDQYQSKEK